jgi:hypothetical protein
MNSTNPSTTDAPRICARCRSAPTLTPGLSMCRACLKAEVDRDRKNREAAQRLAWERSRFERRKREAARSWQAPAGWPEPEDAA